MSDVIEYNTESSSRNHARLLTRNTAAILVLIIKGDTRACNSNIEDLQTLFSEPYFAVQVCSVEEPKEFPVHKTLTRSQYLENYTMRKLLTYAAEGPYDIDDNIEVIEGRQTATSCQYWWANLPVIIIRDSSISHISPANMRQQIATALQRIPTADLLFLCKWCDNCHKYQDIEGTTLKWSMRPTAAQAVLYTPAARDYFRKSLLTASVHISNNINDAVSRKVMKAAVFMPNIIDFDVNLATANDDFIKLNQCVAVTEESSTINWITVAWVIVILLAVIFVAWLLITTTYY